MRLGPADLGQEAIHQVHPVLAIQRPSPSLLPKASHDPCQVCSRLLPSFLGAIVPQHVHLAVRPSLAEVDPEARIAIRRGVLVGRSDEGRGKIGHWHRGAICHAVTTRRAMLEQSASDSHMNDAERARAFIEADDPLLEGFVHHLELELDDPHIVAAEHGEGLGANQAADGRECMLLSVGEGGRAVDERVVDDKIGEVAVDHPPDLGRKCKESGHLALPGALVASERDGRWRIVGVGVGVGRGERERMAGWPGVGVRVGVGVMVQPQAGNLGGQLRLLRRAGGRRRGRAGHGERELCCRALGRHARLRRLHRSYMVGRRLPRYRVSSLQPGHNEYRRRRWRRRSSAEHSWWN
jgi:hypothetical protein